MKKTIKLGAVIFMMTALSNAINAQTATTVVAAKIVEPLTLAETASMHFGTMTSPTSTATVTIDATGARASAGSIVLLNQLPFASAAEYIVTGTQNATYSIAVPSSTTISNGVPANNMTVDVFSCNYPFFVGTIDGLGQSYFALGATLNLASGQASGDYAGTFDVTVAYN
jgi:Domain of unknown function (DUF4402)